jgi:PAS domain S-box-containing protein
MSSFSHVRGASAAQDLALVDCPHVVQFYDGDADLRDAVVEFLEAGLREGAPAVVIATAAHAASFAEGLRARGVDIEASANEQRLLFADANAVLSQITVDGAPDWDRFCATVEPLIDTALRAAAPAITYVRAYGELVDLLWAEHKHTEALRLEEMWNALGQKRKFFLYCAYCRHRLHEESGDMDAIGQRHSGVCATPRGAERPESTRLPPPEVAERGRVEHELRQTIAELATQKDALHRAESELRDFVDNAVLALDVVDPEGRITWANRAQLEMLGYSADEYIGRAVADFHADANEGLEVLARLQRAHVLNAFPTCLRAKDGSLRYVETSSTLYRRDGEVLYSRRFNRDVTVQRLAQRAQAQQELRAERLQRVTAVIADASTNDEVFAAVVDKVGDVLEASSSALWLLDDQRGVGRLTRARGYSDLARHRLNTVETSNARSPIARVLQEREAVWLEAAKQPSSDYDDLELFGSPQDASAFLPLIAQGKVLGALALTFGDGRPLGGAERNLLLVVARYSSQALERWRLLSSERENRRRAELLYGLAAAVMDADQIEQIFDAALDAIESALGADRASILLFDTDDVMRFKAWRNLSPEYRRAVEGHSPWARGSRSPQPIISADVTSDPEMAMYLPLFRREGIGAIGFIPLVSGGELIGKFMVYYARPRELARSELHLARAIANQIAAAVVRFNSIAELQRTVRFNEIFSGILGHDLRNPLNAIVMAAQTALVKEDTELSRRSFNKILASGSRMARMIEQLLDFTRVRLGGGIPLVASEVALAPIVRHAIEELEGANPNAKIRLAEKHDTRGTWDSDRLFQVFSNLLGNAVQHGDAEHGIDVEVNGEDTESLRVSVQNRGCIPPELIATLFEPLCGGEPRHGSRGLGLGLFITREIVRAHGGDIAVHTDAKQGLTVFRVELPRAPRHGETRQGLWSPTVP